MTDNRRGDDEYDIGPWPTPEMTSAPETNSLPAWGAEPHPSQNAPWYEGYGSAEERAQKESYPPAKAPGKSPAHARVQPQRQPSKSAAKTREKSPIKKFRATIIFTVLGLVLLGVGLKLLPSRNQAPVSQYTQVIISSPVPITTIQYAVEQISPSIAKLSISVRYFVQSNGSQRTVPPPSQDGAASVTLPSGVHFRTCPASSCVYSKPINSYGMGLPLIFTEIPVPFPNEMEIIATRNFYVVSHNFGISYDGVDASVSFPQLDYIGPGSPILAIHYAFPSASSYDWSYPPESLANGLAEWIEAITDPSADGHQVLSTVVTGNNYSAQHQDSLYTFIAGAIIGLAASALLAGIQEALHAND